MSKFTRLLFLTFLLSLVGYTASFGQAIVTIDNNKNACNGLFNGSFRITVVSGTPAFSAFVFGISFGQTVSGPLTQGVPFDVTGLRPDNYLVVISDGDPSPNFSTFVPISNISGISGSIDSGFPINNTDCAVPTGQIHITPTGGSGGYSFAWTATNGFTSSSEDINGLAGGDYSVVISDNGSNCTSSLGPISITDPSPNTQSITTPSPQIACTGSGVTITLANSEDASVTYEVFSNGIATGVTKTGTNGALIFTVPAGSFSNGAVLTIQGKKGICTPKSMNGAVTVNIVPLPTAVVSGGGSVCAGFTLPSVTFTFTGKAPFTFTYTDGATPVTVTNHPTTTFTITNAPAGNYSVTALSDANTCPGTSLGSSVAVIVNPLPTAMVSGGGPACAGQPLPNVILTFTGTAPFTFTYTDGTTPVTVTNHPSNTFTITNAPVGTYSVTALSDSKCTGTSFGVPIAVTIRPLPTAVVSGGGTICAGGALPNITFTFTGTAPFTFTYTDGTTPVTITNHPTSTFTVTNAPAGNYSVTALTDANTCSATSLGSPVAVIVNPLPTATVSGGGPVCTGSPLPSVTFTFTGTAPFTFTYTDGTTPVIVTNHPSNTFTITNAPVGTYSVTALSDSKCTGTSFGVPIAVTIRPLPTAVVSGGGTICAGGALPNITFTFTGTAPFTFTYTDGTTPVTITNHPTSTFTVTNAPAGNYSVTALTDANTCSATSLGSPVAVIVNPLPTATVSGGGPVCTGSPLPSVTFTFTGTAPFTFTYTDGTTPVTVTNHPSNTFTITNAPVGTYSVTALSDSKCTGTSFGVPIAVTIRPLPTAVVSGGGTICAGGALPNITFTFTGTAPFTFTYTDGTTPVTITNHPTSTFTVTNAPAGNYSVTALTDANTCSATSLGSPVAVIVNPLPTAVVSGGGTVCSGSPLPNIVFTFTGTAPFTFTYTDGTTPVTVTNHPSATFTITNAPPGTYSVTALSDSKCTGTSFGAPKSVSVTAMATAMVSGGGNVCTGFPLPNVTFTFTGTAPFTFKYKRNATVITVTNHPSATFTITNAAAGTYSITTLTDAGGCPSTTLGGSVVVAVKPLPTAVVSGGGTACAGSPLPNITFTFTGTAPFTFTYTDGTTPVTITNHPTTTFTVTNAPIGTYSVTALSDATCTGTSFGTPKSVSVKPKPTAVVSGGGAACAGSPLPSVTFTFTGTAPFFFTYTDGTTPVNIFNHPSSTYTIANASAGTYSITALADNNCIGTSFGGSVAVIVNPKPTVTISGGAIVCSGDPLPTITITFTGTAPFTFTYTDGTTPVTVTNHPSTTFTIPTAQAGTYSITALTDANCAATVFGTPSAVVVNPLPTSSVSGGGSICAGNPLPNVTFTFTGTVPFTFTYTDGTTPVTITNHPGLTYTVANAPVGTYSVTALKDANCTGTSFGTSASVISNPAPTATIGGGAIVCSGDPLPTITFTFTGTAPFTFTYTDGTTPVTVTNHPSTTFTIPTAQAGTYSITALTDASSCPGSSLGTPSAVVVNPLPTASVSGGGSICAGNPLPNVIFTFTGTVPFTFTYTDGTTPVTITNHPGLTYTVANAPVGTYSVTALKDANCTGTSFGTSASVISNPAPTATIGGGATVCAGDPLPTITFNFTGTAPFTFTYTDGTTPVTVTSHPSTTYTIPTAPGGTYSITALTDASSCPGNSLGTPAAVVVNSLPTASASGGGSICAGNPLPNVTFTFTGTAPFTFTYTDGTTPVTITNHAGLTYTVVAAPVGTYSVTALKDANCTGTSFGTSASVISNPAPTATIGGGATVCAGDALPTITFTFTGTAPFTFTYTDGTTPVTITSHPSTTYTIPTAPAGTYSITALTDASSCPGNTLGTPASVVVNPAPNAGSDNATSACSSATAFNLTGGLLGSPDAGGTWTDVDGSGAAITGSSADFTGVTTTGTYHFLYTVTGTAPCANATATLTVTITDAPNAGISNSVTACNTNTSFDLFANLGGSPDAVGTWTDLDGSGVTFTGNNIDLTALAVGTYHYQYTVTGTAPCVDAKAIVTVKVINTTPNAGSDAGTTACNNNNSLNLLASLGGSPDPGGTWTDVDASGATITGNNVDLTTLAPGLYHYRYDLALVGCGAASSVVTVTVVDGPDAGIGHTVSACNNDTGFDLFAILTGTPDVTGTWTQLTGTSVVAINVNAVDFTAAIAGAYTFQYTVTGTAPCVDATAVVTVNVIGAPNAGLDKTVDACNTDSSFDLFASLNGSPDVTGTWSQLTGASVVVTGNTVNFVGAVAGAYTFAYKVTGTAPCSDATAVVTVNVTAPPNAGTDNSTTTCNTVTNFNLTGSLSGSPDAGGAWTDLDGSGASIIGSSADLTTVTTTGTYHFLYTVTGTAPCANATATLTVTITKAPNAGIANSVTGCNTNTSFDLLASLGGSPDAVGTWADLDASGVIFTGNNIDLTVLAPGIYHYEYTVTGAAPCVDAKAIVTVKVINTTPDAGSDAGTTACNNNNAFNLFTSLGGSPDPGGVWTDVDASGALISGDNVNLTTLAAGIYHYKYDLNVVGCGAASAVVTVTVVDGPDAGTDNTVSACNNDASFNLLTSLGGTPDATGAWSQLTGTTIVSITGNTVNFTPATAGAYSFQYIVAGTAPCGNSTAVVTVNLNQASNAGFDNAVSACNSDTGFNLFASLGGSPDVGGTWTQQSGTTTVAITGNAVDFTAATAGTYTFQYKITGAAPCADSMATVTVNLTTPPNAGADNTVSACNSDTAFNLFASLAGTPDLTGTWAQLTGVPVLPITGNNVDLTTATAGPYTFEYTVIGVAPCVTTKAIVTVNVGAAPTISKAGPDQVICSSIITTLAANTATIGTGVWTVTPSSGVVLTPGSPTSQFVGNTGVAYTLRWIITSGTCPPSIDDVIINFTASPTATSPVTACINTAAPTLTATATGATSFEWYTDAALTNLVFTGASYTPATGELNMGTAASTSFFVIAKYVCGASPATQVVVNVSNTGACGGGGGANCFAFATSDPVVEIRPSCSNQNDGQLIFGVKGGTGTYVITLYDSISNPIFTQAKIGSSAMPITFASLSPSLNYFYKIDDGTNTCVLPYSLPIKTTVQATATALVNVVCFGDSTGRATLTVTGGNSPYEYSIDGGANWVTNFVSGNEINGLPPNGTYNILVRDDSGDLCPAEVPVTIKNANPRLKASFVITPSSCNGNDGAVTGLVGSGGLPSSSYTFLIDGNVGPFTNLGGGSHTLKISDGTCSRDSIFDITFPGFIDFTLDSSVPATCSTDGVNTGVLKIKFPFLGTYQVGLSVLQNVEPAAYGTFTTLDVNDLLSIDTLGYGSYYVWVKKTGVECPTRKGPFNVDGFHSVSFDFEPICIDGKVSLKLTNVKGDAASSVSLTVRDLSNSPIVDEQPLGSYKDTYVLGAGDPKYSVFLSNPGRYNVELEQLQISTASGDVCTVSASKFYTVTAPLSAQIKTSIIDPVTPSASYPDEPTGAFDVINFAGGLEPYMISLTLETPTIPGQSYSPISDEDVLKNNNLQYEKDYSELPAGVYTVVITDSIGCSIPLTAVVPLDMTIFIPNIFTPNDDGKNDLFFIRNLVAHSKLIISNRWGKEVLNTKDYQNNWTGEGVEDGIYFYRLESDSDVRKGWVEILRGVKP